jgi:hypothetical protein
MHRHVLPGSLQECGRLGRQDLIADRSVAVSTRASRRFRNARPAAWLSGEGVKKPSIQKSSEFKDIATPGIIQHRRIWPPDAQVFTGLDLSTVRHLPLFRGRTDAVVARMFRIIDAIDCRLIGQALYFCQRGAFPPRLSKHGTFAYERGFGHIEVRHFLAPRQRPSRLFDGRNQPGIEATVVCLGRALVLDPVNRDRLFPPYLPEHPDHVGGDVSSPAAS